MLPLPPVRCAVSALALLVGIGLPPAFAQTPAPAPILERPVRWTAQQASLADALQAIRAQQGPAALVDGEPLRKTADFDLNGTAREALDRVVEAFDYTWTMTKSGIALLRKRFQDPEERPQVPYREMCRTAADLARLFGALSVDADPRRWGSLLRALAQTFTPPQTQALEKGEKLSAAALSPEQAALLRQAILSRAFGTTRAACEMLFATLTNLPDARLQAEEVSGRPDGAAAMRRFRCRLVVPEKSGRRVPYPLGEFTVAGEEPKP